MVDYLTRADVWGSPTCITAQFPTVAVTMPVNVDPVNHAVEHLHASRRDRSPQRRRLPVAPAPASSDYVPTDAQAELLGVNTGAVACTLTGRDPTRARTFDR